MKRQRWKKQGGEAEAKANKKEEGEREKEWRPPTTVRCTASSLLAANLRVSLLCQVRGGGNSNWEILRAMSADRSGEWRGEMPKGVAKCPGAYDYKLPGMERRSVLQ